MRISLKSCLAGLAGLALVATTACDAAAQAQLQGMLQNVDSISGDVTVKLNDGSVITINLKDVKVEALASAVGSASLEPGSNVTIEMDQERRVTKVKAHAAEVDGVIKSLDLATNSVTIDSEGREVTFQVTPGTKIEVGEDDDTAAFADLQVGQEVEVKYPAGGTTALKIEVDEEDEEDDDDGDGGNAAVAGDQGANDDEDDDDREVHGTITAVNQATNEVTIRSRNGVEATYKVMPGTKLENHGRAAFDAIQTGMDVEAKFHPVTRELVKLEVED